MKKFNKILCAFSLALFACFACVSQADARVRFLGDSTSNENFEEQNFGTNAEWCKNNGYGKNTNCESGEVKGRICPRDSNYFDQCCNKAYNYTTCTYPLVKSSKTCGGKYACVCDRVLYAFTDTPSTLAIMCPSPRVVDKSDTCTETNYNSSSGAITYTRLYSRCECPREWITCDAALKQEGNGSVCTNTGYDNIKLYASCKCQNGYNQLCEDYGPTNSADFCSLNGRKYYKQCMNAGDYCAKQGYTNTTCAADEMAVNYCPQDSSYFLCRKDPSKYCTSATYNQAHKVYAKQGECKPYQDQSTWEKCQYYNSTTGSTTVFGDYYLCIETCKSRFYTAGYRPRSSGEENILWWNSSNRRAIVWSPIRPTSAASPSGYEFTAFVGPESGYSTNGYAECRYQGKGNMTITQGNMLNRNLDQMYIYLDLQQSGQATSARNFNVTSTYLTWKDVTLTPINTANSVAQWCHEKEECTKKVLGICVKHTNYRYTICTKSAPYCYLHNYSRINITGGVQFLGNSYVYGGPGWRYTTPGRHHNCTPYYSYNLAVQTSGNGKLRFGGGYTYIESAIYNDGSSLTRSSSASVGANWYGGMNVTSSW